jgi:integrase
MAAVSQKLKAGMGEKEIAYTANRLASLTGMRAGEILGLRGEYALMKTNCA